MAIKKQPDPKSFYKGSDSLHREANKKRSLAKKLDSLSANGAPYGPNVVRKTKKGYPYSVPGTNNLDKQASLLRNRAAIDDKRGNGMYDYARQLQKQKNDRQNAIENRKSRYIQKHQGK
jgi:hypothetical protein